MSTATTSDLQATCETLRARIRQVVAIESETVDLLLTALLAHGHVLIEGIPGIGKTLLARTLGRCLSLEFRRIQFTNDLMPSDIVGTTVWRQDRGRFVFVRGPLFANVVLADEINRTGPRTLSCLLEAMEQGRVSVEGRTLELGQPFLVLATRNPIEFHGTHPVPEAALDRFLLRVELGYPAPERELALYLGQDPEQDLARTEPLLSREQVQELCGMVATVQVREPVARYAQRVVTATREHPGIALGASPRAGMMWLRAARARALLAGRAFVLPDDLKALTLPVLAHRVVRNGGGSSAEFLHEIVEQTKVDL
ncbi:MAG: AAA family ATPase [Planctomycetes bacterium]|nr:AAA family ATPase [Planctomycetota bacterium]